MIKNLTKILRGQSIASLNVTVSKIRAALICRLFSRYIGKNNIKLSFLPIILVFLSTTGYLYGKPMLAPTTEEALQSKWVVIAQYVGYRKPPSGNIDYFDGPIAQYEIVRTLSGDNLDNTVNVRYDFQDGSGCLPLKGWEFSEDKMPKIKSEWILFLSRENNNLFTTYRGDYGRWEAT